MSAAEVSPLHPESGPPPPEPPPQTVEVFPSPKTPAAVADVLLDERTAEGLYLLRRWHDSWMSYAGPHWVEDEDRAIKKWVSARLEHAYYKQFDPKTGTTKTLPWQPNRNKVADVLDQMENKTFLPRTFTSPSWLDTGKPAGKFIACANGLLDTRTQELRAATPRYFATVALPFAYDPDVGEPVEWLKFLRTLWPPGGGEDRDEIKALQEMFGYILSGRTDLHKMFLIKGPPRCGKGTIGRTLARLAGIGNACAPTLAALATNFGLQPLIGKRLAIIGDARLGRDNQQEVVERLLSITGEDMQTIDRKHKEAWIGKLPTRFLVLSNELPRFGDASGAIATRFVILAIVESWLGREDHDLENRLISELPAILKWALAGIVRLNEQGRFTEPAGSVESVAELADLVSPISAFYRDVCVVHPGTWVAVDTLFNEWRTWCSENGHYSSSKQKFSTDLRAAAPGIAITRPHGAPRRFANIGVSDSWKTRPRRGWLS